MLIDKAYYDYDYEPVPKRSTLPTDTTIWSADKVASVFSNVISKEKNESELEVAERLQREASEHIKAKTNG